MDRSKLKTRDSVLSTISDLKRKGLLVVGPRPSWWAMRFWDWVTGGRYGTFFTTLKLFPWDKHVHMVYPTYASVEGAWKIFAHELVHYYQFQERGWWWMARKYVTQRGRLEIEAPAYALSIELGTHTLGDAVKLLQTAYFIKLSHTEIAREIAKYGTS